MNKFSILLMTLPLVGVVGIGEVQAQITPANDGTGAKSTTVNTNIDNNNQIDITGGKTSETNQFHSLEQFNVNEGQTANFVAGDGITNILTRVTGGNVSEINGKIQVTGGNNPSLFLMNPAGFIFGNGATLNLPGSLTVTTANSINLKFGEVSFRSFSATDDPTYENLTGNPTAFNFNSDSQGAIINSGNLNVKEGQNINLVGGTVVNNGTLAAEDGQISIAAVPGKGTLRISQSGNLLNFDIQLTRGNSNPLPNKLTIESLPNLLAGGDINNVTGITVEDGIVTLTGSGISIKDGDVVLSAQDNIKVDGILGNNVSIISESGNIKTARIESGEKVFLSAEKGNIEVDRIFAGDFFFGDSGVTNPRAGDIDIKAGGFFRAIGTRSGGASITVVNPISESLPENRIIDREKLPFISIKTKNDPEPTLINEPGDGIGEVKIEVGSKFFVVGEGSIPDSESGTVASISAQISSDLTIVKHVDGREFGKPDTQTTLPQIPEDRTDPGTGTKNGTETATKTGIDNDNSEQNQDQQDQQDPEQDPNRNQDQRQNQERSETTFFGVLSLDESLVALLEEKGHATELTLSNDEEGELKGSDFNFFNTDDDEELETFNFDRGLSYKNYVFHRK